MNRREKKLVLWFKNRKEAERKQESKGQYFNQRATTFGAQIEQQSLSRLQMQTTCLGMGNFKPSFPTSMG
jgi:hypothetical protein